MAKREEIIVGLDIGTTKIAAIVGLVGEDGIDIIGVGTHPSTGLRKGVVVNIDATVVSIKHAIEEAEHMAGCEITQVYAGIAGSHVKAMNSHGTVPIKDKEVREHDIARVLETARAVPLPQDREIIHVLPQEYIVDEQDGIKEPLGMAGVRLQAKVHIVTAAITSAQNIIKCCERCNLQVADIVLQPLASAQAVLHEDEKELGVALIDIGGGTTDLIVMLDGSVVHTAVLPIGGNQITRDISLGLRTPVNEAERIKLRHGCAMTSLIGEGEVIDVPTVGGRTARQVQRQLLGEFIEPRVEEIFAMAHAEIQKSGTMDRLASGAVITGGQSLLEGAQELAEEVLGLPVRRGSPKGVGGLVDVVKTPSYATGVGLVLYGGRALGESAGRGIEGRRRGGVIDRMRHWFSEVF
jgi:cell division protein FtsA